MSEKGPWFSIMRGGAAGKSEKVPCPNVEFPKMIPCPWISSKYIVLCQGSLLDIYQKMQRCCHLSNWYYTREVQKVHNDVTERIINFMEPLMELANEKWDTVLEQKSWKWYSVLQPVSALKLTGSLEESQTWGINETRTLFSIIWSCSFSCFILNEEALHKNTTSASGKCLQCPQVPAPMLA